jgi:hypothetical protein
MQVTFCMLMLYQLSCFVFFWRSYYILLWLIKLMINLSFIPNVLNWVVKVYFSIFKIFNKILATLYFMRRTSYVVLIIFYDSNLSLQVRIARNSWWFIIIFFRTILLTHGYIFFKNFWFYWRIKLRLLIRNIVSKF